MIEKPLARSTNWDAVPNWVVCAIYKNNLVIVFLFLNSDPNQICLNPSHGSSSSLHMFRHHVEWMNERRAGSHQLYLLWHLCIHGLSARRLCVYKMYVHRPSPYEQDLTFCRVSEHMASTHEHVKIRDVDSVHNLLPPCIQPKWFPPLPLWKADKRKPVE